MYNFLNINEARRAELLSEQDTGYWETNLELLEDVFAHASIRKKIFDDLLPFIHDMKNAVNLYAYDGKIPIDDLRKQIDLYIRTVIFNEPGPQGAERLKTLKMVNTFAAVTRSMMLGLNPNSLFREPIQGFYMLASRAANRVMGDNSFTVNDLRKAYSRFMRDGGGPFGDNWSMLEHLNHTYGMTQMDVNGLPYMLYSDRKGVRGLARRLPYWATTAPDFLNRMVFLTAQMYHDGAMDAHSIVNGKLIYDWKKIRGILNLQREINLTQNIIIRKLLTMLIFNSLIKKDIILNIMNPIQKHCLWLTLWQKREILNHLPILYLVIWIMKMLWL